MADERSFSWKWKAFVDLAGEKGLEHKRTSSALGDAMVMLKGIILAAKEHDWPIKEAKWAARKAKIEVAMLKKEHAGLQFA